MFLRYHHLSRVLIRVVINLGVVTQANESRLLMSLEVEAEEAESCFTAAVPPLSRGLEGDHQWVNRVSNESQTMSREFSYEKCAHLFTTIQVVILARSIGLLMVLPPLGVSDACV